MSGRESREGREGGGGDVIVLRFAVQIQLEKAVARIALTLTD